MTLMIRTMNRKTAPNTGFASGGVTCKLGALCFLSSVVLVDSFVLRNPPERKARKRWLSLSDDSYKSQLRT
jgi:hypothetical protein